MKANSLIRALKNQVDHLLDHQKPPVKKSGPSKLPVKHTRRVREEPVIHPKVATA